MEMSLVKCNLIGLICILVLTKHVLPYPISDQVTENENGNVEWIRSNGVGKRADVFMSRGWGAGGMPFNVLYTQTPKLTRNTHARSAAPPPIKIEPEAYYMEPQALRSVRQEPIPYKYTSPRRQYSVIPQLFVSYGWGPLGRK